MSGFRVGVDIGGTFTDIVVLGPQGEIFTYKVLSTPDDYARAITRGLADLLADAEISGAGIDEVIHGTTVASNAILEMKGARTGLVTTRGFRDVLEIGRLRVPRLYDIGWQKPPVLVERYLRAEVDERVNARGEVLRPLDDGQVRHVLEQLFGEGIEALAVCLINSYANPVHEQRVRALAEALAPGLTLCLSTEVLPEVREYERTSTTVINAYVTPVIRRYLSTLAQGLRTIGVGSRLLIMQSNGGVMSAEAAAEKPVHIIESGPAAGVIGAQALALRIGLPNIITFDMGGTTAKASIIEHGEVSRFSEYEVGGGITVGSRLLRGAGYLIRVPAIDLAEVGAGGGSIVRVDAAGALQVGPQSAGAAPGPVCYGQGGTEPTITDANVVLGYLSPAYLAGGAVILDAAAAREAILERVARPLGHELADAAHGAYLVAVSAMIRAIKAVSSERGRDPRDYALFAFGGNGPLFAAAMAAALGMRTIIVPPAPGLFSSFGLLYSAVEHHHARTYVRQIHRIDLPDLNHTWEQMDTEARGQLARENFSADRVRMCRWADLRYSGQSFELTVPVVDGMLDADALATVKETFAQEHERTYGHRAASGEPVEIVTLRVVAEGIPDTPRVPGRITPQGPQRGARIPPRRAYFGRELGWHEVPVLARGDLETGGEGPCIIEEYDATCVVPPGARATLDGAGNIVITLDGPAEDFLHA